MNIPGIVGYIQPGAYSSVKTRQGAVSLPGGPTITCIMGEGRREEILVTRAAGGGKDGLPQQFDPRLPPDGRYFRVAHYPLVSGSFELYLNPKFDGTDLPLIQITSAAEGAAWEAEFLHGGYGGRGNSPWSDTISYQVDEIVTYNNRTWQALQANIGNAPGPLSTTAYWRLVSLVGRANDGYGGLREGTAGGGGVNPEKGINSDAGQIEERTFGLDAFAGTSDGTGFFNSSFGRRYGNWKARTKTNSPEPQHFYLDEATGQIILDQPLARKDTLVCRYLAEADMNSYEEFTDLQLLYNKHGYPAVQNTISLAAQIAAENGSPIIGAIHAGWTYNKSQLRWVRDPYWTDAFAQLEKFRPYFVVPVPKTTVEDEVIMPGYDSVLHGPLTGNGTYLQEAPGGGDEPGINIYPLKVDEQGVPVLLQIFKNEREMTFGIDYTVDYAAGPQPVRINLTTALVDGDRIVANYRPEIDLVATVQQVAKVHIELLSDTPNRRERMAFFGGYEGYTITQALDEQTGVNNNYGDSNRTVFLMPERIRRVVNGETAYLDGSYLAAAAAGVMSGNEYLAEPLTRKTLIGFDIENSKRYTDVEQRLLGGAGVSVVDALNSGGRVINGFTTSNTGNAVDQEPSVRRISDYVASSARAILENRFTGKVILSDSTEQIEIVVKGVLESLVSQLLITAYANIRVVVDPIDPRQVDISFDIQPVFPLNWIRIDFSVGIL